MFGVADIDRSSRRWTADCGRMRAACFRHRDGDGAALFSHHLNCPLSEMRTAIRASLNCASMSTCDICGWAEFVLGVEAIEASRCSIVAC
jgi:hypothetical protein